MKFDSDTPSQSVPGSTTLVSKVVTVYVNDPAQATTNSTNIQTALNLGGFVQILTPGLCYINAVQYIKSNTHLYLGPGVEIIVTTGSNCGIFTNYSSRTAGTTITGGNATWVNATVDGYAFSAMRITQSGIDTAFPVGTVVAFAGTSCPDWVGVWEVNNVSSGYIEFIVDRPPSDGANPAGRTSPSTLPMKLYYADENITISGPGTINGNGANQTLYYSGHPQGNLIWMHNVRNVTIDGLFIKRGITWSIGSSNVSNYKVRNIGGTSLSSGFATADGVHLAGAHRNALVENISLNTQDNTVGLTIDVPTLAAYEDFPYYDAGDQINTIIRNVRGVTPAAVIGVYGPAQYRYRNLIIDGVYGRGNGGVQLATYSTTNMNQVTGDVLTVKNINMYSGGTNVTFTGNQAFDSIIIDGITLASSTNQGIVFGQTTGETATYRQVTIKNIFNVVAGFGSPANLILIEGSGSQGTTIINSLTISDIENFQFGANFSLVRRSNAGTIGRINYERVAVESLASGTGSIHKDVAGCGTTTEILFNNCSYTGVSQTGYMYDQGSSVTTVTARFNDSKISGAGAFINATNATPTINVYMNGVTLGSTQSAYAGIFTGPTNLLVNGYNELTAPTNNPFQAVTSGKAYNFKFENVNRTTDLITYTSGASLRMTGSGARTALANVISPVQGDSFYDLTAGAIQVRLASSWSALGGGGGATITNDTTTNATYYPGMSSATSGSWTTAYTSNTKLTFNPSTGTLSSTIFTSLSDKNVKHNIKGISGALDSILAMNGVSFNWNDTGQKSYGVIAQELEQVVPELVIESEDRKTVNYLGIIGFLINSIQELNARIVSLEKS